MMNRELKILRDDDKMQAPLFFKKKKSAPVAGALFCESN